MYTFPQYYTNYKLILTYMDMFIYYGYINLWIFLSLDLDTPLGIIVVVSQKMKDRMANSVDPDGTALDNQSILGFINKLINVRDTCRPESDPWI